MFTPPSGNASTSGQLQETNRLETHAKVTINKRPDPCVLLAFCFTIASHHTRQCHLSLLLQSRPFLPAHTYPTLQELHSNPQLVGILLLHSLHSTGPSSQGYGWSNNNFGGEHTNYAPEFGERHFDYVRRAKFRLQKTRYLIRLACPGETLHTSCTNSFLLD